MDDPVAIINKVMARIVPEPTLEDARAWWEEVRALAPLVDGVFGPSSFESDMLGRARSCAARAVAAAEAGEAFDPASRSRAVSSCCASASAEREPALSLPCARGASR